MEKKEVNNMTEKEVKKVLEQAMERASEKLIENLLEQAKTQIGAEESIIINYEFYCEFDTFYITTAVPMTNIIWQRKFKLHEDGKLKFLNCSLAEFPYC